MPLDEGDHAAARAGLLAATWASPLYPLPGPPPGSRPCGQQESRRQASGTMIAEQVPDLTLGLSRRRQYTGLRRMKQRLSTQLGLAKSEHESQPAQGQPVRCFSSAPGDQVRRSCTAPLRSCAQAGRGGGGSTVGGEDQQGQTRPGWGAGEAGPTPSPLHDPHAPSTVPVSPFTEGCAWNGRVKAQNRCSGA